MIEDSRPFDDPARPPLKLAPELPRALFSPAALRRPSGLTIARLIVRAPARRWRDPRRPASRPPP